LPISFSSQEGTESAVDAVTERRAALQALQKQQQQNAAAAAAASGMAPPGGEVRRVTERKQSRQGYDGADANVDPDYGTPKKQGGSGGGGSGRSRMQAARNMFGRRGSSGGGGGGGGQQPPGEGAGGPQPGGGSGGGVEWADVPFQAVKFDEDTLSRQPFEAPERKDAFWSLLFCAHALAMFLLAITMGVPEYVVAVQVTTDPLGSVCRRRRKAVPATQLLKSCCE
jgi:hypothetical protein